MVSMSFPFAKQINQLPSTYGAAVVEVIKRVLPFGIGKCVRQLSLAGTAATSSYDADSLVFFGILGSPVLDSLFSLFGICKTILFGLFQVFVSVFLVVIALVNHHFPPMLFTVLLDNFWILFSPFSAFNFAAVKASVSGGALDFSKLSHGFHRFTRQAKSHPIWFKRDFAQMCIFAYLFHAVSKITQTAVRSKAIIGACVGVKFGERFFFSAFSAAFMSRFSRRHWGQRTSAFTSNAPSAVIEKSIMSRWMWMKIVFSAWVLFATGSALFTIRRIGSTIICVHTNPSRFGELIARIARAICFEYGFNYTSEFENCGILISVKPAQNAAPVYPRQRFFVVMSISVDMI